MEDGDTPRVPAFDGDATPADEVVRRLDALPQAFERAQLGLEQARAGDTVAVDGLEFPRG
jgi:hypothetical protein